MNVTKNNATLTELRFSHFYMTSFTHNCYPVLQLQIEIPLCMCTDHICLRVLQTLYSDIQFPDSEMHTFLFQKQGRGTGCCVIEPFTTLCSLCSLLHNAESTLLLDMPKLPARMHHGLGCTVIHKLDSRRKLSNHLKRGWFPIPLPNQPTWLWDNWSIRSTSISQIIIWC
jgi:hypothetical protein